MKTQLADTNHRLSQLQTFRSSVARLLHLRDVPHEGILQRLQTLCNAHQVRHISDIKIVHTKYFFLRNSQCCHVATSLPLQSATIHALAMTIWFRRRSIAVQSVRRRDIITDSQLNHMRMAIGTRNPLWTTSLTMNLTMPKNAIITRTRH